jgi:hypothetical protein
MRTPATMTCPRCKLLSPGTAVRCDCGYDFTSGTIQRPDPRERRNSQNYQMGVILSAASFGLGVVATVALAAVDYYSSPANGQAYPRSLDPHRLLPYVFPVVVALLPMLLPRQATRFMSALLLWGFSVLGSASIGLFYIPAAIVMLLAACARPALERPDAPYRI